MASVLAHRPGARLSAGGLTAVEVLVATAVIGVGLIGLATVLPLSSDGLQRGGQLSTATFLAEQRLEQLRAAPWMAVPVLDCVGTSGATAADWSFAAGSAPAPGLGCAPPAFADETPGGSSAADPPTRLPPPYGRYIRQVRVRPCDAPLSECGVDDPSLRRATVRVSYAGGEDAAQGTATSVLAELTTLVGRR